MGEKRQMDRQARTLLQRDLNRREFLRTSGLGAATLIIGGAGLGTGGCGVGTLPNSSGSLALPAQPDSPRGLAVALDVVLRATNSDTPVLTGPSTRTSTYQATVLTGEVGDVSALPGSYLGPIIRARKGQRVRIRLINELSEATIIHWHGMHVPADMDGHPRYAIEPGEEYVYEFEILDRAGTYWFHPHPHRRTGPQVYSGLAGLFLVSDDEESAAGLPSGEYDVPLIIQDRQFDANNQLVYGAGIAGFDGFLGDRVLVNGQPSFSLDVATRSYRLRLLNGSNSRVYKLAWDDGTPLHVVATDGGLLEAPVQRDYIMLAPGERIELWADFSAYALGSEIVLRSLPFSGGDFGMGGMMGEIGGALLPNGADLEVLRARVETEAEATQELPPRLSTIVRYRAEDAVNGTSPRVFATSSAMMMGWRLNGRTFEMDAVAANEIVTLNTLEMWELVNTTGHMEMMHPLHIHGVQFQIVERSVLPSRAAGWETVRYGYVDEGWKDTLLLMPGERAKLLLRFSDFSGAYLYHCHNLEHEDQGMMRNYLVQA